MTLQDTRPAVPTASTSRLGDRARSVATAFREAAVPHAMASGLAAAFEIAALAVAGTAAFALWTDHAETAALLPLVGLPMILGLGLQAFRGYQVDMLRRPQIRLGRVLAGWTIALGVFAWLAMATGHTIGVPTRWIPVWYVTGLLALIGANAAIATVIRRLTAAGRLQRRAVIVGGGPNAEALIQALEDSGGREVKILGIFDDRADDRSPESQAGYPKLGTIPDLVEFARVAAVDLLIVSIPTTAEIRVMQLLKQLWVLPVDIRLAAHASKLRLRPRSYSYIGRVPFLDIFDKPIAGWDSVLKRIFDLVFASLAIVALSPVMVATAVAIRLDSKGPILFRQKRYGFNNEVISVLKFRSMYHEMADPTASKVVTKGDPRVTRVGRFIRRTSIDELPQFFNVLKGDLSLVGPRPHAVNAHTQQRLWEEVVDGYFARHKVKPGVTGWAQINGWRGEVDSHDKIQGRVEHDLHYIENWSVLFDLYILALTPIRILNQENAY